MKKLLLVSLVFAVAMSVLSGCGSNNANSPTNNTSESDSKEVVTLKYALPGTEPKEWPAVKDAVNKKLLADGVNVQIEKEYIDYSVWEQKINLKLSTGGDIDMFHVMGDVVSLANYIGRNAVKDISAEIEQYGPNLKKAIPEAVWDSVQSEGKTYAFPAYWYEPAVDGSFTANRMLLRQAGIEDIPTTQAEMIEVMEKTMALQTGSNKPYLPVNGGLRNAAGVLHRDYDSYPFVVKDKIAYIGNDQKVLNWAETEEFKKDAAFHRALYEKKLTSPDILVMKKEQTTKQVDSGNYIFYFGTPNNPKQMKNTYPDMKDEDFTLARLRPDKPVYRMTVGNNVNVVAANSKNPVGAVKFMNWLYGSQENYDLFMYGIEGKTYNKVGERGIETILDTDKKPLYIQDDWMIGNLNFIRYSEDQLSASKELYHELPEAESYYAASFFFDSTPVKAEIANVQAVYTSDIMPIYDGVVDYESNIDAAIKKLKTAGIEKLIAEYQKQLDAFVASSK